MSAIEDVLKSLGFLTPFAYGAAAYGLFHWADKNVSDEAKAVLAATLRIKDYDKSQLAQALVQVFDWLYTHPLLTWRGFIRSLLATLVVTAIFLFEMRAQVYSIFLTFVSRNGAQILPPLSLHLGTTLLLNVLTDYLSLFIIRQCLFVYGSRPVFALFAGAFIGVTLFYFVTLIRFGVFMEFNVLFGQYTDFRYLGEDWIEVYIFQIVALLSLPAVAVFVWLPLFGLGIVALRTINVIYFVVGKMQRFLKHGNEHPLDAVGYVAGAIVFVSVAAWQHIFKS